MQRRNFLRASAIAAAVAGTRSLGQAVTAQGDSTPPATPSMDAIPPIVWDLVSIDDGDDSKAPEDGQIYSLQFFGDGSLSAQINCNTAGGNYTLDGESLKIDAPVSTLVACEDPNIDRLFVDSLANVSAWSINSDGSDQLVLQIGAEDQVMLLTAGLTNVVWQWQTFAGGPDQVVAPDDPSRYSIEFKDDNSLVIHADCNSGKGSATIDGNGIDLKVSMTKKACGEGSYFDQYFEILDQASSFVITSGNLYLDLPMDGGEAIFVATLADSSHDQATPGS
jgi:heat shock protein HslJ